MKIDRKLNIVIPVQQADETVLWVHARAIGAEIFDRFYRPIARAHAAMHADRLGAFSAPRVADKYLRDVSQEMGVWEDVKKGLVAEIHRLTNVVMMGEKGWHTLPYDEVKRKQLLDPEDSAQVEAALVFFTLSSSMYPIEIRRAMIDSAMSLWSGRIESLNSTEFMSFLATSTEAESSSAKTPAS